MKKFLLLIAVVVCASLSWQVQAGPAAQELGVCLTDSLTGKERKDLAKWIFFAIAAHPEISSYSKVSEANQQQSDEFVGNLVTRLMADDCPQKSKNALQEGGSVAFEQAFGLVGQVAMQELMADHKVLQTISGYEKYLDQTRLRALSE